MNNRSRSEPEAHGQAEIVKCRDLLLWATGRTRHHGIEGRVIARYEGKPNFIVEIGQDSPTLLWNGHLDVVTAGAETWEHDPFGGEITGGYLHGRGSVDMKGSVAAVAEAFLALAETKKMLKGTLKFTAVADEETLGEAGTQLLAESGELKAWSITYKSWFCPPKFPKTIRWLKASLRISKK